MLTKELKQRAERCCCRYCGHKLEIHAVIFNQYGGAGAELYCPNCQKIEYGTEYAIYEAAKDFVDEMEFSYYLNLEDNERTYQMNIAKVCEIISWICKEWGWLNKNGLAYATILDGERENDTTDTQN